MARVPSLFSPGSLLGTGGGGDPFLTLHREMNRLFDDVLRGSPVSFGGQQGGSQAGALLAPHMDVSETDEEGGSALIHRGMMRGRKSRARSATSWSTRRAC